MKHITARLALALALIAMLLTASGFGGSLHRADAESVKVALVETGPKEDGGWNSLFLAATKVIDRTVPEAQTTIVADVNPGAQVQSTIQNLVDQGFKVIILNGAFASDIIKVGSLYPDTTFLVYGEGAKKMPNVTWFLVGADEGGYLNGVLAGAMTKSGILGYVGSYQSAGTRSVINGFTLGAQSVRPNVKVKVLWINSYYDPPKERQAASALVDAGADVLMQDNSSPASAAVAQKRGVKYVGWAGDRRAQAPKAWLGGFTYNWGPLLAAQVQKVVDGTWKPGLAFAGLADRGIALYPAGATTSSSAKARHKQARDKLVSGKLVIFKGRIWDTRGKVVVPKGSAITSVPARMSCCAWLVRGIESKG